MTVTWQWILAAQSSALAVEPVGNDVRVDGDVHNDHEGVRESVPSQA